MVYEKLVLSGGGVKGVCYIGVLKALEEKTHNITHVVGTSAGSLFGMLIVLGYTCKDLYAILKTFKFEKLLEPKISGIINDYGLDSGEKFEKFLKVFIKNKGYVPEITLKEFHEKSGKTLTAVTCCVNERSELFIDYKNYPDMPMFLAVRMSCSIPVVFKPVSYAGKFYVDGCVTCNYPVMNLTEEDSKNTLCVLLRETKNRKEDGGFDVEINNLEEYLYNVAKCSFNRIEKQSIDYLESIKCKNIIINVPNEIYVPKIGDFKLTFEQKQKFINIGYSSAIENL